MDSSWGTWRAVHTARPMNQMHLFARFHLDWPILLCIGLLFSLGLLILYSAKLDYQLLQKQTIRLVIAAALMVFVAQIPPRIYQNWAIWLYSVGLAMLVLVLFFGLHAKGAQRWLNIGIIRFQPAELMKLAVPLMVARYLNAQVLPPTFKTLLIPLGLTFVPALLIALQPDLGTAILVASTGVLVIFFAGVSWRFMLISFGLGVLSAPLMWFLLHDYQKERILTFLNPERDPLGSGYHIIQSKIAIGSGGLYGKGWLNGTQSHLEFLPERTTDFIFAVFGEEFGLIGILVLLTLFFIIIVRGLYLSAQAQDTFSRLVSGSLIMTFFVYLFVNIGMVNGLLPVVGIPLPLISYGGTSMVTIMVSFGIVMSIATHRSLVRK